MALDGCDLDAELSQRRRDLRADESKTDDDGVASPARCFPDSIAILDRAQLEDALEVGARHGKRLVASAGGYEQAIVGHGIAMLHDDHFSQGIDRGRPHSEAELDVALLIERGVIDELVFESVRTAEITLRQGRPVVRQLALSADEHDVAIPAFVAQDRRRPGTGQRRTDDDDSLHVSRIARNAAVSSDTVLGALPRGRVESLASRDVSCKHRRMQWLHLLPPLAWTLLIAWFSTDTWSAAGTAPRLLS